MRYLFAWTALAWALAIALTLSGCAERQQLTYSQHYAECVSQHVKTDAQTLFYACTTYATNSCSTFGCAR